MVAAPVDGAAVETIAARLAAAGVESPRLEAQLLLALACGCSRAQILARIAPLVSSQQAAHLESMVAERLQRRPLAYIRGWQEFHGLRFKVDASVLIPRPETEMLVEFGLAALRSSSAPLPLVVDLGTGSGCIAISLAVHMPHARVIGLDASAAALGVARDNARQHGADARIGLLRADYRSRIVKGASLILCNPPYIPSGELAELEPEVAGFEPTQALTPGPDGLLAYRDLAPVAFEALAPGGAAAFEVGAGQADAVCELLEAAGFDGVAAAPDMAGIPRIVSGHRWR